MRQEAPPWSDGAASAIDTGIWDFDDVLQTITPYLTRSSSVESHYVPGDTIRKEKHKGSRLGSRGRSQLRASPAKSPCLGTSRAHHSELGRGCPQCTAMDVEHVMDS